MRIALSTDINSTSTAGPHKFMRRLARALRAAGVELVDRKPDVYLRFAHHRPRRDACVDIVRLDGLYPGPSASDRRRNRRIVRGARRADGIVFQNAYCREAYRRYLDFDPPRYAEIINGADPTDFAPRRPQRMLLANAHWHGAKRLPAILDAFCRLTDTGVDAELHVTGEPDQRLDHPQIVYLGRVDEAGVRDALSRAAASVHLAWLDWCPNAMVEAVVARCPVIYTDSGGQPSIAQGAGITVPDTQWDFTPVVHNKPPPLHTDDVVIAMRDALEGDVPAPPRDDLHIDRVAAQYIDFFDELLHADASPRHVVTPSGEPPAMNTDTRPTMHCHDELLRDLEGHRLIDDTTLMRWANDGYSTSRHLPTLYSLARGVEAKQIIEIGFGRSSFVLARAAAENGGRFATCDTSDFSYLLSDEEKAVTTFHHSTSDDFWPTIDPGVGFAFLDYFSSKRLRVGYILGEIDRCLQLMLTDGIIAVHDAADPKYRLHKALKKLGARRDLEVLTLPYCFGLGLIRYCGRSQAGAIAPTFERKPDT